jgi:hypothetical protein
MGCIPLRPHGENREASPTDDLADAVADFVPWYQLLFATIDLPRTSGRSVGPRGLTFRSQASVLGEGKAVDQIGHKINGPLVSFPDNLINSQRHEDDNVGKAPSGKSERRHPAR